MYKRASQPENVKTIEKDFAGDFARFEAYFDKNLKNCVIINLMKINNPIFRKASVITSPFTWLIIIISIGLNFGLSYLMSASLHSIGIMLYLDCIFTIIISCILGYFPGLVVGMGTNLLNCVFDADSIYYAFISGGIAIVAGLLMRTGFFRKWWGYILAVFVFSFLGGGVGSVLTYFLYGQNVDVLTPSLTADLYNLGCTPFWANFFSNYLWDLLDKTITMGVVLGVFLAYPKNEKALDFFPNTFMLRTPWNKPVKRKFYQEISIHSLDFKIVTIMTIAYVLLGTAVASVLGLSYHNSSFNEAGNTAKQYATAVTYVVDGDEVGLWLSHQEEIAENPSSYGYSQTFAGLKSIEKSNERVLDVYVFTPDGKTVLDLKYGLSSLGKPIEHNEEYQDFLERGLTDDYFTHDGEHGHFLSYYSPIVNTSGQTVAYAVANIDASKIGIQVMSSVARILAIEAFVFIIGGAVLIHNIRYFFIAPLQIVDAEIRAYEAIGPKKWLTSKARKGLVKLRGKDEISNLSSLTHSTMDFASESILKIEEQAAKLIATQKGVVFALAEIIESRDKCTADHTTRTSNYSQMIARELVKEGKHTDILTDEYLDNFAIAAALHDVGKIKIPDAILNKPGKLTPEEYDIMKEHTLEGEKIIGLALEGIGVSSDYLTTAKEVSGGHHEKWDGNGYPRGLKGTEIPLCARIVAIADVFDALTCKRPYKEPWPFEKAVAQIQEESGTHFDPEIVDAFLAIKDDVKQYLEKK